MTDTPTAAYVPAHIIPCRVVRVTAAGGETITERRLIPEAPLEITVNGRPLTVAWRTPGTDELLAAGALFNRGLITGSDDIIALHLIPGSGDAGAERMECVIRNPGNTAKAAVSPGTTIAPAPCRLHPDLATLLALPDDMTSRQELYHSSRAAHAVGLYRPDGTWLACLEDAGRTNALEKAIGYCIMNGLEQTELVAVFSGRINTDMATRIVTAGFPVAISISAPTDRAVALLRGTGCLYYGSVRNGSGIRYAPAP
jgi:FdhD protein